MIPAGGDGLTVAEKMEIARQRYGRAFIGEEKMIKRGPKSAWLLALERKQAKTKAKTERITTVVQIKRSTKK